MFLRSIPFLVHEAVLNVRRQGLMTLASISTVAISLCIVGVFGLIALRFNAVTDALPRQWEFHAFTRRDLTADQAERLRQEVQALPGVKSATLLTSDEVWTDFRNRWGGLKTDLEGMDNPMPHKLEVQSVSPKRTMALAARVRGMEGVATVKDGGTVLPQLLAINRWVRNGSLALAALLVLGTMAIISNAIRLTLFARRREIRVMQLVGATNGFVRLPFLLEGVIDGLLGGLVAWGLLAMGYDYLNRRFLVNVPLLSQHPLPYDMALCLGVVAVGGLAVGLFGSMVSIRRFLRV